MFGISSNTGIRVGGDGSIRGSLWISKPIDPCGRGSYSQCSQRSGTPVGPGRGTAKSPGPDGTAECGPHPS